MAMQNIINEYVIIITKLRNLFFSFWKVSNFKKTVREISQFQPIFILFLDSLITRIECCNEGTVYMGLRVDEAQSILLSGQINVSLNQTTVVEKEVTGHTDIYVIETASDFSSSILFGGRVKFHAELKSPFCHLFQNSSGAALDQLLTESEIIGQMTQQSGVAGVMTDLFAISNAYRTNGIFKEGKSKEVKVEHFSSRVVTDAHSYVLRILLLLCRDSQLLTLLPGNGQHDRIVIRLADSEKTTFTGNIKLEEMREEQLIFHDWNSKRLHLAPLTAASLSARRNHLESHDNPDSL